MVPSNYNNLPVSPQSKAWARAALLYLALGLAMAIALIALIAFDGGTATRASASDDLSASGTSVATSKAGVTVMALGDVACAPGFATTDSTCRQQAVAQMIAKQKPRAILLLGDLQYNSGAPEEYAGSFGVTYAKLKPLLRPAPGNHDYATAQASGYNGYFGAQAGPDQRGYYSFNVGKWHLVSLNSNCTIVPCDQGSAQLLWLRKDLAKSSAKCTLAYWHHPLVASGKHGNDESVAPLWAALRSARADLVLSGHDHAYERFAPLDETMKINHRRGMREFVVGTGGRSLYPEVVRQPGSVRRISAFGALQLKLGDGRYAWHFIGEDGKSLDSGATQCR